jgi:uncharacterized membrane protein
MFPETAPGSGAEPPEDELRARVMRLEAEVAELRAAVGLFRPLQPLQRRAVADVTRAEVALPMLEAAEATGNDLESQLARNVLSKVAVLLLLAGAAWFLKWAFDNRWIGARGRVLTGMLAGAAILVWSERFRKTGTPSLSYALKAVGSGVLYLSLWASFQLYHQIPATVALLAMIAVTAWNALLAWTQDSRLLAGYALLGAYLTPLLLSTGGNHEVFLMVYLASIALGVLVLLRSKPWNLLLLGPLPVTAAFFIGWYARFWSTGAAGLTLWLSLLLWAVLAAMPLVAIDDAWMGVLQPVGAALFGALAVYSVLVDGAWASWEAWAAVGFAAVYLAMSRLRRGSVVSAMHLSLALAFLTVAIPLKATGHGITVGWLAEALAVLWLAGMPSLDLRARAALQWLGIAAMLLGTGGALLGPWVFARSGHAFWNREFATAMAAALTLVASMILLGRPGGAVASGPAGSSRPPEPGRWRVAAFAMLNVLLLVSLHREISLALNDGNTADFAFSGWMALQGTGMLLVGFWRREALARWTGLLLLAATIVKTVGYDMRSLGAGYRVVSYLALGVLLLAISFAYEKNWLRLGEPER